MKNEIIKEGVIDAGFISTLEAEASRGGPTAVTRAALAHLAAGEFELTQHEPDKALEHFEAMEPFAGQQRDLLLASLDGRIYAQMMKSEYTIALELIEKARKLSPQSANLAAWSGYTHYRMNQIDAAIDGFADRATIRPSQSVAALLDKAKRDKNAEDDFREGESSHFVLRYHGGASRQLASEVIHTLEDQFQVLKSELHYTPPEQIGVILYTQESFFDVTRVPGWAGGLNDGRIRVPVQGLETVSDLLARILKHELTHSFVYQKTDGRCPTWLQEGVAQWMEGRRTGADAAQLRGVLSGRKRKTVALSRWTVDGFVQWTSTLRVRLGPCGRGSDRSRFRQRWPRSPARCRTHRIVRRKCAAAGFANQLLQPGRLYRRLSPQNLFAIKRRSATYDFVRSAHSSCQAV